MSRADALAKIKALEAKAVKIQQEADDEIGGIMAEIRDTANQASGDYQVTDTNGNGAATTGPATTGPATTDPATTGPKTTGPKTTGQKTTGQKKAKKKAKKKAVKKTTAQTKKSGKKAKANAKPLREVIWDVLSMSARSWKKHLKGSPYKDLPKGVKGLKAVEIQAIIENGKLWSSKGAMGPQISQHLMTFRQVGLMERGDQQRYNIVEGAEFE
jgi:hypothetical protein